MFEGVRDYKKLGNHCVSTKREDGLHGSSLYNVELKSDLISVSDVF
jgi:hypothetical protein